MTKRQRQIKKRIVRWSKGRIPRYRISIGFLPEWKPRKKGQGMVRCMVPTVWERGNMRKDLRAIDTQASRG
jgi:hypothetical protein